MEWGEIGLGNSMKDRQISTMHHEQGEDLIWSEEWWRKCKKNR